MFWKRLRIRYYLKCLLAIFRTSYTKSQPGAQSKSPQKRLLLLKLDAIGDYILFRNFLQYIRNSDLFRDYQITLCGNPLWKDISLTCDQSTVDEFIWVEPGKWLHDKTYRNAIIDTIQAHHFDQAVNCRLSRDFLIDDRLMRACDANKKTGSRDDYSNQAPFLQWFSNRWYNQLIPISADLHFEFERNKFFFEQILQIPIPEQRPSFLPLSKDLALAEPYILLFPGAGEKVKEWPPQKFASVIQSLRKEHPRYKIYLCGSKGDIGKADLILSQLSDQSTLNLCGQYSLTDTMALIEKATLVICNDSSPLHMAAALKTKALCILDGRHYGRFAPYPAAEENGLYFVYPDELTRIKDTSDLFSTTRYFGVAPVEGIAVETVISRLSTYLADTFNSKV